jgi:hypothetical protein
MPVQPILFVPLVDRPAEQLLQNVKVNPPFSERLGEKGLQGPDVLRDDVDALRSGSSLVSMFMSDFSGLSVSKISHLVLGRGLEAADLKIQLDHPAYLPFPSRLGSKAVRLLREPGVRLEGDPPPLDGLGLIGGCKNAGDVRRSQRFDPRRPALVHGEQVTRSKLGKREAVEERALRSRQSAKLQRCSRNDAFDYDLASFVLRMSLVRDRNDEGFLIGRHEEHGVGDRPVDQLDQAGGFGAEPERNGHDGDLEVFSRRVAERRNPDRVGLQGRDPLKLADAVLNGALVGGRGRTVFEQELLWDALIHKRARG